MRRMRGGIWMVAAAVACASGPTVEKFAPAHQPAGVELEVRLRHGAVRRLRGELITVGDSDLVVRDSAQLWRIPLRAVAEATTRSGGTGSSLSGGRIGASRRLVLLSRYPQGMSDDVLRRLLAAYGLDSMRTVP